MRRVRAPVLFVALFLACGQPAAQNPLKATPADGTPARIAYDVGLTQYLDTAEPSETTQTGVITTFTFDPSSGPQCLHGAPFRATVREMKKSEDLLIFLQGGGACWSAFCLAVTAAPSGIPVVDALNQDLPENPFAGMDTLYVPYCDGSLFIGENEVTTDAGVERKYHGLQNLSAALTMGYRRFPHPRRVVLIGASAGGYGTITAALLVRYVYPDVPIQVVDDSGLGLGHPGAPEFVGGILEEFNARRFIPSDCADCLADGHLTGLVKYELEHDPALRIAALSSWDDFIIGHVFLELEPQAFRDALQVKTGALHDAFPDRYRRFIYSGRAHTALLGAPTAIVGDDPTAVDVPPDFVTLLQGSSTESLTTAAVGDVALSSWLRAMMTGDDAAWPDTVADAGALPMNP